MSDVRYGAERAAQHRHGVQPPAAAAEPQTLEQRVARLEEILKPAPEPEAEPKGKGKKGKSAE